MPNWLDLIPDLGVPGVTGVQGQKTAVHDATPVKFAGVPGVAGRGIFTPAAMPNACKSNEEPRQSCDSDNPAALLCKWHSQLSALDEAVAPASISGSHWRQALKDARWIYENFAAHAVRNGWSAHDLFGILPTKLAWGGLADRLRGSRDLEIFDARALWTHRGHREQFNKGASAMLLSSGLKLIWHGSAD